MNQKRDKFVELAQKRVTRTIRDIRLIGNLSNRNNYSYSASDVQKIAQALEQEVKNLKAKFTSDTGKANSVFTL
jgi:arginine repressor